MQASYVSLADGVVEGTSDGNVMGAGYFDNDGSIIDGADGLDDLIYGFGGNDLISGGDGDDNIYGGAGADTAIYSGNWSDYTIAENGDSYMIVDNRAGSPDGTDTVINVETFEFADGTVTIENLIDVGPTDIDISNNYVDENSSGGTIVGTLSAIDNVLDSHTYEITYDPSGMFEVSGDQIFVKAGADIDAETAASHDITVEVTDASGFTYSETMTINVNDLDEFDITATTDTDASGNILDENASIEDVVGITALATDVDATDDVSYSLTDDAAGLFTIDSSTGVVTIAGSLDAEKSTSHTIEVTAASDDGSTSVQSFSVSVNDVNETSITAVSDTDGNANSVSEATVIGTAVGVTAFATDADAIDTVIYTISSNPGGFFAIDGNTGIVTITSDLDFENTESHTIQVTAISDDGSTSTQSFTINVIDVDEYDVSAVSDGDASANAVSVDASNGDSVGIIAIADDADGSDTVSYSLSDDAGGVFTINATTGEVTVADASQLDLDVAGAYDIEVTASSSGGSTSTQTHTIDVNEVNEAPTDMTFTGNRELEITTTGGNDTIAAGSVVGNVGSIVDQDLSDTFTFLLSDDAGGKFAIDADTGEISVIAEHDASTSFSDNVTVAVTDSGGNIATETIGISLGTSGADALTGTTNTDIVYGFDGADSFDVAAGDNIFIDGDGIDTVTFGGGDNYVDVGDGVNTIVIDPTLFGNNVVITGSGVDTITVGNGDNRINAGDGANTITAGSGNNVIIGGSGIDTFTAMGGDNYIDAAGAINTVTTGDGNDYIINGSGADTISGGATNTVISGNGDDYIKVNGGGINTLDGGEGTDTLDYSGSAAAIDIDLSTNSASGGYAEGDVFLSFENVTGSAFDDNITGNSVANIIEGGAGNDIMYGGSGNDIFLFGQGDGADTINGGLGGGWVDTIVLNDSGGDLGEYGTGWALALDSGAIDAQDANSLTLSDDADGAITLADGSTVDFLDIERIEF